MAKPRQPRPAPAPPDTGTTLAPGEETVFWTFAHFATGVATPVAARRWYRDPQGLDIEPQLEQAGWPHRKGKTSPPGAPRWEGPAVTGIAAGINVVRVLAAVAVELAGGISGGLGDVSGGPDKQYLDPALDSEDFPVMVAAPGTIARSAPWQLDPDRCSPDDYAVIATFTTERMLVTCVTRRARPRTASGAGGDRQLIWQVRRQDITSAQHRRYSRMEGDAIIHFADGSWVRLSLSDGSSVSEFLQWLEGP